MVGHVASGEQTAHHRDSRSRYAASFNRIVLPETTHTKRPTTTRFWRLGRIILGVAGPSQAKPLCPGTETRPDGPDHWVLRVARLGTSGRQDHPGDDAGPVEMVLETLAEPLRHDCGSGEWVTVIFPGDLTPGLAQHGAQTVIGPLRHAPARLLGHFVLSLAEQMPMAGADDMPRLAAALRAMIVATLDKVAPPPTPGCRMKARIDDVIFANIASARLDPARIAELVGVSRSTLYRLFEGSGGIAAHVQRMRLNGVRADLTDPARASEPISRVAERWGFYSVTSFNRAFRAAFGMTPGEARKGAPLPAREGTMRAQADAICAQAPR
jgi:AraC-like DNA-binding protein